MKTMQEVYELFNEVGCCSFATLDGKGGVDSRIAHFFAYDDDFNMVHRDHKILRERFGFHGAAFEEPGLSIDPDRCIACGACAGACTHKAIVAPGDGGAYRIRGERCDECGNCYHVCPAGAVISKGVD